MCLRNYMYKLRLSTSTVAMKITSSYCDMIASDPGSFSVCLSWQHPIAEYNKGKHIH